MELYNVVIVGAGICGLSAAHTFLTIDPNLSLLVIDGHSSIGGVWSTEQIYPGLRTNSVQGNFEYSDYPVLDAGVGVKPSAHLDGHQMHAYLDNCAKHFGLIKHIRLATHVTKAIEDGDEHGWTLETKNDKGMQLIHCEKLVMATGPHSSPYRPPIEGLSSFKGEVIHTAELAKSAPSLCDNTNVKNVTVIGGAKSAHDATYMFVNAGKHVDWILPSGGAVPMARPASKLGPLTLFVESVLFTRFITWFGPAPWGDSDGFGWIRWFLHKTRLGNRIVRGYWKGLASQSIQESGILEVEKAQDLRPRNDAMFYGTQVSALNYPGNFYDLFRDDKATLAAGALDHIDGKKICMDNGVAFDSDAIVLATGFDWTARIPLEPASKDLGRGCPVDLSKCDDTIYPALDAESDRRILAEFPLLRQAPSKPAHLPSFTPWRLWRFLAPPSRITNPAVARNLVFLDKIACFQTVVRCELTSLWAYAYLYDRLTVPTPTESEARSEVSLWTRFSKFRAALGMQGKQTDFLLEGMPYYDLLLQDLGLKSWRKGWGWIGEVFWGAYSAKDYRGIVQEWMATQKEKRD